MTCRLLQKAWLVTVASMYAIAASAAPGSYSGDPDSIDPDMGLYGGGDALYSPFLAGAFVGSWAGLAVAVATHWPVRPTIAAFAVAGGVSVQLLHLFT